MMRLELWEKRSMAPDYPKEHRGAGDDVMAVIRALGIHCPSNMLAGLLVASERVLATMHELGFPEKDTQKQFTA